MKLNRLSQAYDQSCSAVDLYGQIGASDDEYFDAVSLLVRICHLQKQPAQALSHLNQCPEGRRDYVRNQYTRLKPTVAALAAAAPILVGVSRKTGSSKASWRAAAPEMLPTLFS